MKLSPIMMEGESTFNAFAFLRNGAHGLLEIAKGHREGSNYSRISAVLFSTFAVEAYLNHIGEARMPSWETEQSKLSWRDKLDLIAQQLNIEPDFGVRPFQTLIEVFKFRNKLAHGRTTTAEFTYRSTGKAEEDFAPLDPEWLRKYWSDDAVERVLLDTGKIMELVHEKAGYNKHELHLISSGNFSERKRERDA